MSWCKNPSLYLARIQRAAAGSADATSFTPGDWVGLDGGVGSLMRPAY